MSFKTRRVVTGHGANGKAIVLFDDEMTSTGAPGRGIERINFWSTEGFPVNNDGSEDTANAEFTGPARPNGTAFRIIEFGPGNAPMMHRTDSIDYALILKGEIDMELDDGRWVHLREGDVLVQRGTIHNWVNKGSEPCRIAFILIDAKPVEAAGKTLYATGFPGAAH